MEFLEKTGTIIKSALVGSGVGVPAGIIVKEYMDKSDEELVKLGWILNILLNEIDIFSKKFVSHFGGFANR